MEQKIYFQPRVIKGTNECTIPASLCENDVFETYTEAQTYMNRYAWCDGVEEWDIVDINIDTYGLPINIIKDKSYGKCVVDEVCPHCETEVVLSNVFAPQKCPVCGKWICPCNMCDHDVCNCADCPVSALCKRYNELDEIVEKASDKQETITIQEETRNEKMNPLTTRFVNYIIRWFELDCKELKVSEVNANNFHEVLNGYIMNALVRNNANNALIALQTLQNLRDNGNLSSTIKTLAERLIIRFLACATIIERKERFTQVYPSTSWAVDDNGILRVIEYDHKTGEVICSIDGLENEAEYMFSKSTLKEEFVNNIIMDTNFIRMELQEVITEELARYLDEINKETQRAIKYFEIKNR